MTKIYQNCHFRQFREFLEYPTRKLANREVPFFCTILSASGSPDFTSGEVQFHPVPHCGNLKILCSHLRKQGTNYYDPAIGAHMSAALQNRCR
jgi:predicted RNA-binding Zn-ribbon protein involved in translation (DUF1610 family)